MAMDVSCLLTVCSLPVNALSIMPGIPLSVPNICLIGLSVPYVCLIGPIELDGCGTCLSSWVLQGGSPDCGESVHGCQSDICLDHCQGMSKYAWRGHSVQGTEC